MEQAGVRTRGGKQLSAPQQQILSAEQQLPALQVSTMSAQQMAQQQQLAQQPGQQVYRGNEDDDDDDGQQDDGQAKAIRGKNWRTLELLELVNAWQYCLDHKSGIDEKSAQFNSRVHERFAMHCRGECGATDGICKRNAKSVGDKMASIKLMYKFIKDFNMHKKIPDSEDKPDWYDLDKKERKDFARRYDRQQFQIQVYEKLRAMFDADEEMRAQGLGMQQPLVMAGEKRRADMDQPILVAPHAGASGSTPAKRARMPIATSAPRIDVSATTGAGVAGVTLTGATAAGGTAGQGAVVIGPESGVVAIGNSQLENSMQAMITQQTNMFLRILQETRQADREDQERQRKAEQEERKQDRDAFLQAFRIMMDTFSQRVAPQATYRSI